MGWESGVLQRKRFDGLRNQARPGRSRIQAPSALHADGTGPLLIALLRFAQDTPSQTTAIRDKDGS